MGAILTNGAHPHFNAFYRILSKDKRTHKQTQLCKRNSNPNLCLFMAKMKPEIPAGKFVILNRINKQGETTINLRFHMDGYVKRSTGIAIPPAAWDEKKCCVKATYPQAARINADLTAFKQDIDRKLLEYDGKITKSVLNFILNGGDPANEGDIFFLVVVFHKLRLALCSDNNGHLVFACGIDKVVLPFR